MLRKLKNKFVLGDFGVIDYIVIAFILLLCFFSFQQGDLLHTAGSSFAILNGHILDFYDYNAQGGLPDSYMISTYIIFAVWNIPVWLMGYGKTPTMSFSTGALMWFKLCPTLFYCACGYLIYLIAKEMGMGEKKSKICAILFFTTPMAVFSQFIFGQYDSITLFFILLGVYYYYKDNNKGFVISFSIAITLKYFALLLFLPLLFLKTKDIWKILGQCILVVLLYMAETVIYIGSEGYKYVTGFAPTGYAFKASINIGNYDISIVVVLVGMICAFSYFKQTYTKQELIEWSIFLCSMILFAIFGLCPWHPQWLLLMVPFLVFGELINKNTKPFLILDILIFLIEMMFTVNYWSNHVDQALVRLGVWGKYIGGEIGNTIMMRDIYVIKDLSLLISFFSGILLIMTVFKHPRYNKEDFSDIEKECQGWMRTRFLLGMAIFLVPMGICILSVLR